MDSSAPEARSRASVKRVTRDIRLTGDGEAVIGGTVRPSPETMQRPAWRLLALPAKVHHSAVPFFSRSTTVPSVSSHTNSCRIAAICCRARVDHMAQSSSPAKPMLDRLTQPKPETWPFAFPPRSPLRLRGFDVGHTTLPVNVTDKPRSDLPATRHADCPGSRGTSWRRQSQALHAHAVP